MAEPVERSFPQSISRHFMLYVPEDDGPFPLVVAAHGYGGDRTSMMRLARRIGGDAWAVASLQGPYQHLVYPEDRTKPLGVGFGWLTNFEPDAAVALHAEYVLEVAREAAADPRVEADRFFLLGFSQASALNFRFAFAHPERVGGVVAICGGIPGDWETGPYRDGDFDVLLIGGENDDFYPPDRMRANGEALRRRARSVDVRIFDVGHEVPREAYTVIFEWVRDRRSRPR